MATIPRLVRLTTNYNTRGKHFFNGFYDNPNPSDAELKEQRLHQRRPTSQNPFEKPVKEREPVSPVTSRQTSYDSTETKGITAEISGGNTFEFGEVEPPKLENPGPTWIYLFYDLSWTATFASLTQNGQFNNTWDSVSYGTFFMVVWWMWTSQVLYSIHFYTNDWFHLVSIFLQLIIYGMLAATTRGFDVTNYITHSPGISYLDPLSMDEMNDPGRYANERLVKVSIDVIGFSIALSRVLLLIQYLRVLAYAHLTVKRSGGTIPGKLYVIPIGLCISTPLFFAAWGVSRSPYGTTPTGASVKFYLWGFGLLIEGASHLRISRLRWLRRWIKMAMKRWAKKSRLRSARPGSLVDSPDSQAWTLVMPQSDVQTRSRLEAITTIILGEGINGIAGTLYSVVSAPSLGGPIVSNVTCAAFIVCFLAYLYFEGPTGSRELKARGRRRASWVVLHFPFLLCVILLLQGVKNQFLLTSFLSSANSSYKGLGAVFAEQNLTIGGVGVADNVVAKEYFIKRGLSWKTEYTTLMNRLTQNGTVPLGKSTQNQTNEWYAWNMRLSFKIQIQAYKTFTPSGNITQSIQAQIDEYNTNLTYPLQDWYNTSGSLGSLHFYQVKPTVHMWTHILTLYAPDLDGAFVLKPPDGAIYFRACGTRIDIHGYFRFISFATAR
ncbi:low temperature requirement protein LtrA [Ceratobasidium sp. AG-Ba]|nr:low temperature requirement protein LtrA [Ceratobasidium sp. AG-Ba]